MKVGAGKKGVRIPRSLRTCKMCFRETEDEMHFMLRCPAFETERVIMLHEMGLTGSETDHSETSIMARLMAGDAQKAAMKFAQMASKRRRRWLSGNVELSNKHDKQRKKERGKK